MAQPLLGNQSFDTLSKRTYFRSHQDSLMMLAGLGAQIEESDLTQDINFLTDEGRSSLISLRDQLKALLKKKLNKKNGNLEHDPAVPIYWVSKWFNECSEGFGFELCDNSIGVCFKDCTTLFMENNDFDLLYVHANGSEEYYSVDDLPTSLMRKETILLRFKDFMAEHLIPIGDSIPRHSVYEDRSPYVIDWLRGTYATSMYLTNGTLQIDFVDHRTLILCPLMGAVTYIESENKINTYLFSAIGQHGCCKDLMTHLDYALRKINSYLLKE